MYIITGARDKLGLDVCNLNELLVDTLAHVSLLLDKQDTTGVTAVGLTTGTEAELELQFISQLLIYGDLCEVWSSCNAIVQLALSPDIPLVYGDRKQLQRLIIILLMNAVEAMEMEGNTLLLATSEKMISSILNGSHFIDSTSLLPGHYVCLTVHDASIGMDETVQAQMFDLSFRTKSPGRSLELCDLQHIVESHGGGVKAESHLEKGAMFHIFLPAHKGLVTSFKYN